MKRSTLNNPTFNQYSPSAINNPTYASSIPDTFPFSIHNRPPVRNTNVFPLSIQDRTPENSPYPLAQFKIPSHPPPWGEIGYIVYKRTYARRLNEDDVNSETEEWPNTLQRCIHACVWQLHVPFTVEEQQELFDLLYNLKMSLAGRFLWQLGTKTVKKFGLMSLQNCAAVAIDAPIYPFTWTMDSLMCGVGCGFNIQYRYVSKLPKVHAVEIKRVDEKGVDFIVPDSREGWVKLLAKTLKAHFYSGRGFTYSCLLLRSKGAPIRGFGGVASGPDILCEGIEKINKLLNHRAQSTDPYVTPVDCLDIQNIIGMIVVAGNVRRSAELAIGDALDSQYLDAKRWDIKEIPNWRSNSNNSIACERIEDLPETFWEGYHGNGEPYGLINLGLSRSCGRLGETQYPDPNVIAYNPCAEQSLANYETCCLAETFLPNIESYSELEKCLSYLYRICKHSLALPCHQSETENIVHQNMRMGIGMTGYLQTTDEQKNWLSPAYQFLRQYDVDYSAKHQMPQSIKLTTVKPSGSLSLLAGVTPGVHPGYAKYFIRRVRMSSESPLIKLCREHGYDVEFARNFDGTNDTRTMVVSFPCQFPDGTVLSKQCTAIQQLEFVRRLQTEWSDNSVSCTVYYRKEELPEIKEWLKQNYTQSIKSVSFLLHSEHGFDQAPYEEITEETYQQLKSKTKPIYTSNILIDEKDSEYISEIECEGGVCPIR